MAGHINILDRTMWRNLLHGAEFHIGRIKGLTENQAVGTVYRASMNSAYFPYTLVYNDHSCNLDFRTITLPSYSSSSRSKEQQEKDNTTFWGRAGAVGTILMAYFAAKTYRSYHERAATLEITTDLYGQLLIKTNPQSGNKIDPIWKTLSDVVELYHYVIKSECEKSRNYFYGAVILLSGFASMATGGLLAAATWITVGKVVAFVGAILIALNWGYYTQSDILDYACAGLIGTPSKPGLLKVANLALDQVNDNMQLNQQPAAQTAQNSYQPLYPQVPAYAPPPAYNPFRHVKIPEASAPSAPPEGL